MKIILSEKQLKAIIKKNFNEGTELDELDYDSFHNDENLQDLRDSIDRNKLVSVSFVKKDGTVKHMLVRKTLSTYVGSDREKTDAQMNVESNHNIKRVVDINSYKKELKRVRVENPGIDDLEAKQIASKKAWRSINLQNVLGFMVGGRFIDLRDENDIINRFGEEVNGQLTKSMLSAVQGQAPNVGGNPEGLNESFWTSIFGEPTVRDAADTQLKSKGYSEIGRDNEDRKGDNYLVFNGQKFYPEQIQYADYQDMGDLPRIEGDRLIIVNPAWKL